MGEYANNNHYNKIDEILKYISSRFVTLRRRDCNHVNIILTDVVQSLIDQMSVISFLFDYLYEAPFYGGSYYSGLKIKKPDEFDIDLKLRIPDFVNPKLFIDENSGYVQIKLQDVDKLYREDLRELKKIVDEDNFLVQSKTVSWVYGLICKTLSCLNHYSGCTITPYLIPYYNGPAVRLNVCYRDGQFDIDLVISFVFSEKYWPDSPPFKSSAGFEKKTFLAVPKKPKLCTSALNRFFRLSFQEQENELLRSNYHGKPVFRLLKKLRDTRMHSVSSYVLKTIFLWEVEEKKQQNDETYWRQPLSVIFQDMLEKYQQCMSAHEVLYFWNNNENLIIDTKEETTENIANFLDRMLNTINSHVDEDIYIFAKYLLTENEYQQLINHFIGTPYEVSRNDNILYQEVKNNMFN